MMEAKKDQFLQYAVPSGGFIFGEDANQYVLCKPKLMPLRSYTMEKLEKMQREAEEKMKTEQAVKEYSKIN